MPLKPIHQWKVDSDGNPKLNANGKRILHSKAGQPKSRREMTDQERKDFDDKLAFDEAGRKRHAQEILKPIDDARKLLE